MGRSEACNEVLCTIFRATKADVTTEYEGCEEETLRVEGVNFSFDEGEGVMTFVVECRVLLDAGGVSFASGGGVFLDEDKGVLVVSSGGEAQCVSSEGSGA